MTFLVLGDLSVDVMGLGADDDRNDLEASSPRGTKTLRAKEDTVATVFTSAAHDDGLKNATHSDVFSELGDLLVGKLCSRVVWVLVKAISGHLKRLALDNEFIERRQNRGGGSLGFDALFGSVRDQPSGRLSTRRVDKVKLLYLRRVPGQAHERIVPLRSSRW